MLNLTRKADYGLRLMLEVGAAEGVFVTTRAVAKRQGIPYPVLRQVATTLAANGLLVSARGRRGGVRLARPATEISLIDVANVFGGVALNACTAVPVRCTRRGVCPAFPAWVQAQIAVNRALGGTDLESLLRNQKPPKAGPRTQGVKAPPWTAAIRPPETSRA
ncbi:MAG: Rrf2 family transcriptional regulator [Chloroflexota bacterium]